MLNWVYSVFNKQHGEYVFKSQGKMMFSYHLEGLSTFMSQQYHSEICSLHKSAFSSVTNMCLLVY